jgi:hypothetical protein
MNSELRKSLIRWDLQSHQLGNVTTGRRRRIVQLPKNAIAGDSKGSGGDSGARN